MPTSVIVKDSKEIVTQYDFFKTLLEFYFGKEMPYQDIERYSKILIKKNSEKNNIYLGDFRTNKKKEYQEKRCIRNFTFPNNEGTYWGTLKSGLGVSDEENLKIYDYTTTPIFEVTNVSGDTVDEQKKRLVASDRIQTPYDNQIVYDNYLNEKFIIQIDTSGDGGTTFNVDTISFTGATLTHGDNEIWDLISEDKKIKNVKDGESLISDQKYRLFLDKTSTSDLTLSIKNKIDPTYKFSVTITSNNENVKFNTPSYTGDATSSNRNITATAPTVSVDNLPTELNITYHLSRNITWLKLDSSSLINKKLSNMVDLNFTTGSKGTFNITPDTERTLGTTTMAASANAMGYESNKLKTKFELWTNNGWDERYIFRINKKNFEKPYQLDDSNLNYEESILEEVMGENYLALPTKSGWIVPKRLKYSKGSDINTIPYLSEYYDFNTDNNIEILEASAYVALIIETNLDIKYYDESNASYDLSGYDYISVPPIFGISLHPQANGCRAGIFFDENTNYACSVSLSPGTKREINLLEYSNACGYKMRIEKI